MEQHVIVTFASALAASFFGALAAFWLENKRRLRAEAKGHVRSGNLALYNIYDYWNAAKQYYDDVIAPFESRDDAWFNMHAATDRFGRSPSLHDVDLSFILGAPQSSVYADVYLQEHRYYSMRELVRERDQLILGEVWPLLGGVGIKKGDSVDLDAVLKLIGDDRYIRLQSYADGIIENARQNLESFVKTYDDLYGVLKELYPKENFIKVSFELAYSEEESEHAVDQEQDSR